MSKDKKKAPCFFHDKRWWHQFNRDPFKEGDICKCKQAKIIKGRVKRIVFYQYP